MADKVIPFNVPYLTGRELSHIRNAQRRKQLSGDGLFTRRCQAWIEENLRTRKAFLTHSCTSALEMAAILANIRPGDEVIMPAFTFVSTANAFVLRGGVPVFVDIRADTLNLDESLIEDAITRKTKAIVPVHYAGVGCEMSAILKIARRHNLVVIEDAAHGVKATYKGRELGTMGDFGALSFHETKNIISGEGGALLVNNPKYVKQAEIVWQKGTDRSRFLRGEVDKYSWWDVGSSFLPGELMAAFLWAQLQKATAITQRRLSIWKRYNRSFQDLETMGLSRRPRIPKSCQANAHNYYLLLNSGKKRDWMLQRLRQEGVSAAFHYLPLNLSPFATKTRLRRGGCPQSKSISERILRLPFYTSMTSSDVRRVIQAVKHLLTKKCPAKK
jgi:dTDP-4-amino-4,6-dideoxygalactose transaminase